MPSGPFDLSRARLRGPDYFKRYQAPDNGELLAASGLGPEVELLVVEKGGAGFAAPAGESRCLLHALGSSERHRQEGFPSAGFPQNHG